MKLNIVGENLFTYYIQLWIAFSARVNVGVITKFERQSENKILYGILNVLPSEMHECSMVNYRALIGGHEDKIKYMGICVYCWENICSICPQTEYEW